MPDRPPADPGRPAAPAPVPAQRGPARPGPVKPDPAAAGGPQVGSGGPGPPPPSAPAPDSPGPAASSAESAWPAAADERLARAAQALAAARADARSRGFRSAPAKDLYAENGAPGQTRPAGRPAGRQRLGDPQPLDAAISGLVAETGWGLAVTAGSLLGRWAEIVGPDLAAHTTPDGLADGELTVSADSTAWATQLRLLAGELVRRLNAELGDGTVRRVKVRGPSGPARRPGEWRVRGGRGPRDTYG